MKLLTDGWWAIISIPIEFTFTFSCCYIAFSFVVTMWIIFTNKFWKYKIKFFILKIRTHSSIELKFDNLLEWYIYMKNKVSTWAIVLRGPARPAQAPTIIFAYSMSTTNIISWAFIFWKKRAMTNPATEESRWKLHPCVIRCLYWYFSSMDEKINYHFFHEWHCYPWIRFFHPWLKFSYPWMEF